MRRRMRCLREYRVDVPSAIILLLLQTSELLAKDGGRIHEVYCLRRGLLRFPEGTTRRLGAEQKRRTR